MKAAALPILLLAGLSLVVVPASAQLVLGQYEDEAPLGTWNCLGAPAGPALALGGTQAVRSWDVSASLVNPALLASLPRLTASLAASYGTASLFRYALVNTGVVESTSNLSVGIFGLDHGGVAWRSGPWAVAAVMAAPESYGRPGIVVGDGGYQLTFNQSGYLRVFHAAVARRLPWGLTLGLGLNYAAGRLDKTTVEQTSDILRIVTITDEKRESLKGFFFNAGLTWTAASKLTAALFVRSPYVKDGNGSSLIRYEVPAEGTDIRIDATALNAYRQPWIVGAGVSLDLAPAWTLAAEADWFGWSRYEVTYFDESLDRPFRDIVRAGAGVQFLARRGSGRKPGIPLRLGVLLDPQPVTSVRSTYLNLTFGAGLVFRSVALDIGAQVGQESGSGRDLRLGRIVLSFRYIFRE
jgi:hypothetical protein